MGVRTERGPQQKLNHPERRAGEVLGGRFAAPPVPQFAVRRDGLLSLLDVALQQRLTIVVAPPGYGKTVLLSQWAASRPREQVRWLMLTREHNDAADFARDLCSALESPAHPLGASLPMRARAGAGGVGRSFIRALLRELEGSLPTTLVLDDFHVLSNVALLDECASLIENLPRSVRVVIATRADPPLRYYRFRLSQDLVVLRQEDLAFTNEDAGKLIRRLTGHEVSEESVDALATRTEGWVAGLQLAALSLRERTDVEEFVQTFAGDDRHVADYLTEEVLRRSPDDVRRFLLATSVLDQMSAPLCDFVTDGTRSQAMLEQLHRNSMFITALDPEHQWLRYHQLFRTLLRYHLRYEDPDLERTLLLRAAQWHLVRRDLDAAMSYLAEARAWEELLDAAFTHGGTMLRRHRVTGVATWIERVPPEVLRGRTTVKLLEAASLLFGGRTEGVRELLDTLDEIGLPSPGDRVVAKLLRAHLALAGASPRDAAGAANRVLRQLRDVDDADLPNVLGLTGSRVDVAAAALVVRGVADMYEGRFADAQQSLETVTEEAHGVWRTSALAARALVECWAGRLSAGERLAAQASMLAAQLGIGEAPVRTARLALALAARDRDDLEHAALLLDDVAGRLEASPSPAVTAWIVVERAHLALAAGQPAAGLAMLKANRAGEHPSMPRMLLARRAAVEAQLLMMLGDLDSAARSLDRVRAPTIAEVRAARVRLAVERDNLKAARAALAAWPEEELPRARLERMLWAAILDHLEGRTAQATEAMAMVVAEAAAENDVGLFRGAGRHALSLARSLYRTTPTAFLRTLVERPVAAGRVRPVKDLVEQLTEREYILLALLPTRLSNAEIAEQLSVSVNTIKTHLKHIYRKLNVIGRSDAVAAAERLHLL